jgi:F-type H+-transporting ATPase subunit c
MGDLRSSMIVAAALVEGVALFGVIIAVLAIVL